MASSIVKKITDFIIWAALIISIAVAVKSSKDSLVFSEEIEKLKKDKIVLLAEHEECLKHKELSLKKELINRYLDSMILLVNKIEKGEKATEKELSDYEDRREFIIENLKLLNLTNEEIEQYLLFISSADKTVGRKENIE